MLSFQVFQQGFSFSFRKSKTFLLKLSELLHDREAPVFLLPFLDKTYKNAMNQRQLLTKLMTFMAVHSTSLSGAWESQTCLCEVQQVSAAWSASFPWVALAPPPAVQELLPRIWRCKRNVTPFPNVSSLLFSKGSTKQEFLFVSFWWSSWADHRRG